ncbi:replicative DNA helicase [Hydrogenovibrio thermophilus]|uniref:Replicative DNA helicase n=1 Tax=Hydrogenovibrio thermophilus TaxID=265883 RepID=A0A410H3L1_9GAMM|nr:replicative DNA helicase [Hydrogenovibrio thermophilus]QAB15496.1 replicative DNA helicase [Hydrogenovibrio thermophilus]
MTQEALFKTPPHSIESEQSVIGGLLLDNEKFSDISVVLKVEDFYTHQHQLIYGAISQLSERNKPFDLVTVIEMLESTGKLEDVGDKQYLIDLVSNTPGSVNIEFYAETVREKSILRSLIAVSNEISEASYFPQGKDIREVLDLAESRVMGIAEHGSGKQREYETMETLLNRAVSTIDERFNSDGSITGLATKLTEFDEVTSGLQNGDLIIVAGRPSMGKTTFSMNLAENVAMQGSPVAVFSMEMPGEQLVLRMISSIGKIDAERIRTGKLQQEDWPSLNKAVSMLSQTQFFIDDTPALMITDLRARARRIDKDIRDAQYKKAVEAGEESPEEKVTGLGLIVIDYLQLMRGSTNTDNRVNEISEISRGLKAIAKELNVPVIALSQLSRNLEQRPDKRPKMADLRESGAIEQDADLIIFIYRDEVYNPDTDDKGTAEIILGKHRNGALANIRLTFMGQYTKFENHAGFDVPDDPY